MPEDLVCYCPTCAAPITPVPEDTNPGDVYVCYNPDCLTASVLTDALTLRRATADDIRVLPIHLQQALIGMQRSKHGIPQDVHC